MMKKVNAWVEEIKIPTYGIGEAEKNPVFLEKRVYQGSSGAVYPYPVIEKIEDVKSDKIWKAIFLENAYLKIMILPELGGRVQMAYDKIKQRHFVYYNQVIKPALVGLTGPWISGGIEFNWPQHHRPSTYDPVDFSIEENSDGSVTAWCSEIERMFRTKGMAGFTLYPDKAYMEIKVKLYNRTPHPQTFLWWANPAVKVNDHYQSVFPPDVNAVFDHGKRDVSTFPIATGTYYKVDYSAGVDISKYKNIPVPTSYMAIKSEFDFIGCYEHDTQGGMLHVANHHVSPGKKQWTWGNGDFGQAWDRNLTDEDGPYIELMCGVYTDNQPDFSWLMPYEEKSFSQFFMPFREIGHVKNATKDVLLNVELEENKVALGVYSTSEFKNATIRISQGNTEVWKTNKDLSPLNVYTEKVTLPKVKSRESLMVEICAENGKTLLTWKPEKEGQKDIPEAAKAAKPPKEIEHIEQLYLTGLHLEQYRHATFSPADYYSEALRRDAGDVRCNNAMGLIELKKGNFEKGEQHFKTAITTLTERNPNPYEGEPYFNLGLALRFQGREQEAFDTFYKAVWNDAWQASGYFQLAQIATKQGNYEEALGLIDKSLLRQWHNHKARHLKMALLRLLGHYKEAEALSIESLVIDRFNFGIYFEDHRRSGLSEPLNDMSALLRGNIHNYTEIALDYFWAGLYDEAIQLLSLGIETQTGNVYPMAWYYLGWFHQLQGDKEEALMNYQNGEAAYQGTCFPNQLESVLALKSCIDLLGKSSKAPYYLGNFYYHNRQYKLATKFWEQSINNNDNFPTVHRNLALAYYNKMDKKQEALIELEKAFDLDKSDARVFMELDALYKRVNKSYAFRLDLLEENIEQTEFRDDLYLEKITLLNFLSRHKEAFDLLLKRKFHPWEGGEGKVTGQYVLSLLELAKKDMIDSNFSEAISKLDKAKVYPYNLGEGKLIGAQENDLDFLLGYCYEAIGNREHATEYYKKASQGNQSPSLAMFYNDQQPDKIFYQGLALYKLGHLEEAKSRFETLLDYGRKHENDQIKVDYFAVSLPDLMIWDDDLSAMNSLHCKYLMGLGRIGLGEMQKASDLFNEILVKDNYHTGAFVHLKLIESGLINFLKY